MKSEKKEQRECDFSIELIDLLLSKQIHFEFSTFIPTNNISGDNFFL